MIPPGGSGTVTYTYGSGWWSTTTQTSDSTQQVATYTLNTAGKVTSESVQNVDLSNNDAVTQVSSASLTYYTTNQSGGNAGDLELMQTFDQSGVETSATYYRYYGENGENGVRTIFLLTRGDSPARIGAC